MNNLVLVIPHLKLQNANALSSPFTIGFPAMTAWLGAMHALQRKLRNKGVDVRFAGIGVISHQFHLHTYKGPGDFDSSIVGTANPVGKDGKRPSFIEEARCNLTVSLAIEFTGLGIDKLDGLAEHVQSHLPYMKFAGGDVLGSKPVHIEANFDHLKRTLMPGYALLERRDLMVSAMESGQDAGDALLEYLAVHHHCVSSDDEANNDGVNNNDIKASTNPNDKKGEWISKRKQSSADGQRGWIVPIATGFQALTQAGIAENQRDSRTEHRFAESVVTLGEFKMVFRLDSLDQLIWRYKADEDTGMYLCQQQAEFVSQDDAFEGF